MTEPLESMSADEMFYTYLREDIKPMSSYSKTGKYVYFIACQGWVKIGYSKNPEVRISQLRDPDDITIRPPSWDGNPKLIAYIHGDTKVEAGYHRDYAHLRGPGEWFKFTPELQLEAWAALMTQTHGELRLNNLHLERLAENLEVEYRPHRLDDEYVSERSDFTFARNSGI